CNVLVVVVLDLHDLVAWAEGPAEALDADLARWVEGALQLDVEGASAEPSAVHRAEHLDLPYRVEPKSLRDALLHHGQQLPNSFVGVRRVDEVEIAALDGGQLGRHRQLGSLWSACVDASG